ncbi:efflux RND transporter periplasmic adaptor subunit [Alteromonas sp. D210916BOD_24]|uniref:efflux RND transporter periplasmic adaptor subunit n=1 Tax=Alteromonas sp. D210916BOD_24 TaxID=3157618 RepID=UPI00399C53A8
MKWMKFALPIGVLVVGYLGMKGIEASASDSAINEEVDTRPTVTIEALTPEDVRVELTSYGEIKPLETTNLAAQVSGEVERWNAKFVSGGLVRRGEVLFEIEADAYEAALLLAEANLASAQAQLIQEQAQADVAAKEAKTMPDARVTDLYLRKPQVMSAQAGVKSAQAQLKIAQRDLENCKVKAPYDALIVSRDISTGDYVTQGSAVAVLNNIEYAEVTFPIAGFDKVFLSDKTIGSEITIEVDDILGSQVKGIIHRDTGVIDNNTRMSYFVARIEDPYAIHSHKPVVKFGSYSTVSFEGKTLSDVYRVPQELVTNRLLWTLDDNDKLKSQKVTVVREENGDFLIQGEFNPNKVVMSLPEYPQNGMAVKVIKTTSELVTAKAN